MEQNVIRVIGAEHNLKNINVYPATTCYHGLSGS